MKKLPFLIFCIASMLIFYAGCDSLPSKNAFLAVESTACAGCGACTKVCKGDAILIVGNKAVIDPNKCLRCGNCVRVCPYDAIH